MIKTMMDSPIAWLILSLATILSLAWGIVTYLKGNRKKELSYYVKCNQIIRAGKTLIPKLELKYDNQEIEDLSITRVAIWCSGNSLLERKDIVEKMPLSIRSKSEDARIFDGKIIKQSEVTNEFQIICQTGMKIDMDFSYVEKEDGIVIQLMHSGNVEDLEVTGKIKGGKIKCINKIGRSRKSKRKNRNRIPLMLGIVLLLVWIMCAMIASVCYQSSFKNVDDNIGLVVILVYSIIVSVLSIKMVKSLLYMNVPPAFRKEFNDD